MTRSRTQVLRGYLPGQTFQHQNETIVKSIFVEAQNSGVDPDVLFENLQKELQRWHEYVPDQGPGRESDPDARNRAPGFPELPRFQDRYQLLEPYEEVRYIVWPLLLRCTNPSCEKVVFFRGNEDWAKAAADHKKPARCDKCQWRREQMPYIQVHTCGNDNTLLVPACEKHGMEHVYLKDERSFETSTWRCRAGGCGGRYLSNMRYQPCGCGEGGGYVSRTIRQEDRFITHTISFVSFERAPRLKLARTPGAEKVVVGYWLGMFDDYEQALLDAGNEPNAAAAAKWPEMEKMMRANPAFGEADIEQMRKRVVGETAGALAQVADLVPESVCFEIGREQRARERTLIWSGSGNLRTWRLADFRKSAEDTGRHGAVQVLDDADAKLRETGFSDLLVVENFPVALAAVGYSRLGRSPATAQLKPFPPRRKGKNKDQTPIYVVESKTEAVFFELDAVRTLDWLVRNELTAPITVSPDEHRARLEAKAAVLTAVMTDERVNEHVSLLQHTLAHALIRNLGERSGFAANTMSEYLIPELLTFGVYADTHQEFTLGALVSLAEHRLAEWLDAAVDGGRHCDWDPQCGRDEGACMGCLHLSFGCDHYNENLDRAVLFGSPHGHKRHIAHGFWS
jgi:hypothetical protein